jgi:hypothetical protein
MVVHPMEQVGEIQFSLHSQQLVGVGVLMVMETGKMEEVVEVLAGGLEMDLYQDLEQQVKALQVVEEQRLLIMLLVVVVVQAAWVGQARV